METQKSELIMRSKKFYLAEIGILVQVDLHLMRLKEYTMSQLLYCR